MKENKNNYLSSHSNGPNIVNWEMKGLIIAKVYFVSGNGSMAFSTVEIADLKTHFTKGGDWIKAQSGDFVSEWEIDFESVTIDQDAKTIPTGSSYDDYENVWLPKTLDQLAANTGNTSRLRVSNLAASIRDNYNTLNGFVYFVTKFELHHWAYSIRFSSMICMQYETNYHTHDEFAFTTIHEAGHIFSAYDEYTGACTCGEKDRKGIPNMNCSSCSQSQKPCIMSGYELNHWAICHWTKGQIGWWPDLSESIGCVHYNNWPYIFAKSDEDGKLWSLSAQNTWNSNWIDRGIPEVGSKSLKISGAFGSCDFPATFVSASDGNGSTSLYSLSPGSQGKLTWNKIGPVATNLAHWGTTGKRGEYYVFASEKNTPKQISFWSQGVSKKLPTLTSQGNGVKIRLEASYGTLMQDKGPILLTKGENTQTGEYGIYCCEYTRLTLQWRWQSKAIEPPTGVTILSPAGAVASTTSDSFYFAIFGSTPANNIGIYIYDSYNQKWQGPMAIPNMSPTFPALGFVAFPTNNYSLFLRMGTGEIYECSMDSGVWKLESMGKPPKDWQVLESFGATTYGRPEGPYLYLKCEHTTGPYFQRLFRCLVSDNGNKVALNWQIVG